MRTVRREAALEDALASMAKVLRECVAWIEQERSYPVQDEEQELLLDARGALTRAEAALGADEPMFSEPRLNALVALADIRAALRQAEETLR